MSTSPTPSCPPGTRKDKAGGACIPNTSPSPPVDRPGRACEFGLQQCPALEECAAFKDRNRFRVGACRCIDGYHRNLNTGICETRNATNGSMKMADKKASAHALDAFTVKILGPRIVQLPMEDVNLTAVIENVVKNLKRNESEGKQQINLRVGLP